MKTLITLAFALGLSGAAIAQSSDGSELPMTDGTVTKVDTKWNKVTIDHGPLENLDMPAMKMVFDVSDPAMIETLSEGQAITFAADRVKGKLTVVEIAAD